VWAAYRQAKASRRVVDLDDILEQCAALLAEDPRAADAARWRHRHVFVDEYQDLNPMHCRLLHAWAAGRPDVCVVGDPAQAIYGFNGAVPDLFDRLGCEWPGVEVISLDDNFRSSPEIVGLAGVLRAHSPDESRSRRPPGPVPTLTGHADIDSEAAAIAHSIAAQRIPGRAWSGMAVIARTNARLRVVADLLTSMGIPWRMRDPRPLADQADVQEVLASAPESGPAAALDVEGVGPALSVALAEYRAITPAGTVREFASWLDATGVTADDGDPRGVDLATFHRAKGLEWRRVWVAGADELGPGAEDRRLLYVGLTRAEEELAVSWVGPATGWITPLTEAQAALAAAPSKDEQRRRIHELAGRLLAAS
jgi:DNA helicase-2/ATP-dependent DNA helicase PcrA